MAYYKIRPRSGTADQWRSANPVLLEREIGYEVPSDGVGTGVVKMKMGDGITAWNDLPYAILDTPEIPDIPDNTPVIGDEWSNSTTYEVGDFCIYDNKLWKCLVGHTGVTPSEGTYWTLTNVTNELNSSLNSVGITYDLQVALSSSDQEIDLTNYKKIAIILLNNSQIVGYLEMPKIFLADTQTIIIPANDTLRVIVNKSGNNYKVHENVGGYSCYLYGVK